MFPSFHDKRVRVDNSTSLVFTASDGRFLVVLVPPDTNLSRGMINGNVYEVVGRVASDVSIVLQRYVDLGPTADMKLINDTVLLTHDARFAHIFPPSSTE
ncbi:hypothetical protein DFH06DRAFT_1343339 [Mycena polygramma]|nr:hypothetical protein DFH06DRAFT_1343339 [Mycena polygramma]